MYFRSNFGEIPKLHHHQKRNQTKPEEDHVDFRATVAKEDVVSSATNGPYHGTQPVHFKIDLQMPSILPTALSEQYFG